MSDIPWFERAFDAPYLEVYAHRDIEEAERATRTLLAPHLGATTRVVDLACGGGRWLVPLAASGPGIVGLDLSWALLRQAARAVSGNGKIALLRADMRAVPLRSACCDMVLSLFTSFGYFEDRNDDLRVLDEARRLLRPGGAFFLDVFNAERVRAELEPETRRQAGRYQVHERRRIDEERNLVIKDIELRDASRVFRYREQVRLWEDEALQAALRQAGFRLVRAHGDYDGAAFDVRHSPRLILHAEPAGAAPERVLDSPAGGRP